jgi:hypothetical protein
MTQRPSSERPSVRPSVIVRVTTLPASDVNVMLEGCSLECCHTFRQLFRVVNSIKKLLLAAICVCLALSPMRSMFCNARKFVATSLGG